MAERRGCLTLLFFVNGSCQARRAVGPRIGDVSEHAKTALQEMRMTCVPVEGIMPAMTSEVPTSKATLKLLQDRESWTGGFYELAGWICACR